MMHPMGGDHAGRYNFSFFIDGKQPVAPSAVASRMTGETPREIELREIPEVIGRFAAAARRAKQAGYDAVEVLAGTGYLISEFLSPLTNLRTDAYGGSLENRMRYGVEVVEAVRRAVGADYPILVRMNGNDFMPGGNGRADLQAFAQALVAAGTDALNINVGWHEARVPQIVTAVPRGVYAYLARGIRELVDVPVAAGHRINDPRIAREMIADGMCDFVAMGRALIADPFLPAKAAEGREASILHCVACAQGCFDNLFKLKAGGVSEEIQADTVVLAIGAASYNPLEEVLTQTGIPCRVVGDAGKPGWAFDAIHQGFEAGRTID